MGLMFEVAEGGFLDIDVRIEGKFSICTVFCLYDQYSLFILFEDTFFDFINKTNRSRRKDCSFGRARE